MRLIFLDPQGFIRRAVADKATRFAIQSVGLDDATPDEHALATTVPGYVLGICVAAYRVADPAARYAWTGAGS